MVFAYQRTLHCAKAIRPEKGVFAIIMRSMPECFATGDERLSGTQGMRRIGFEDEKRFGEMVLLSRGLLGQEMGEFSCTQRQRCYSDRGRCGKKERKNEEDERW